MSLLNPVIRGIVRKALEGSKLKGLNMVKGILSKIVNLDRDAISGILHRRKLNLVEYREINPFKENVDENLTKFKNHLMTMVWMH